MVVLRPEQSSRNTSAYTSPIGWRFISHLRPENERRSQGDAPDLFSRIRVQCVEAIVLRGNEQHIPKSFMGNSYPRDIKGLRINLTVDMNAKQLPKVLEFTFCRVRVVSPGFCPVRALSLCQVRTSCATRREVSDETHKPKRAVTNSIDREEFGSLLNIFNAAKSSLPHGK
jgi:hypothetical protein